jgi:hypothetical protein
VKGECPHKKNKRKKLCVGVCTCCAVTSTRPANAPTPACVAVSSFAAAIACSPVCAREMAAGKREGGEEQNSMLNVVQSPSR